MGRKKSSQRWLKEHFEDEFVRRAQHEGRRSRGVYKLQEIDAKDRLRFIFRWIMKSPKMALTADPYRGRFVDHFVDTHAPCLQTVPLAMVERSWQILAFGRPSYRSFTK